MNTERDWKGIWIPREIWTHPTLKWYDKIIIMEVDSFTKRGADCFFSDRYLADFVGVSERSVRTGINRLVDEGLLERCGFDGRKRFMRSLLPTYTANAAAPAGKGSRPDRKPLPKKKLNEKTKEQTSELVFPWESQEFRDLWNVWKDERRLKKIKKYTPRGEQAALHKLHQETSGDMAWAMTAIKDAIANGYQGIFPKQKSRTRGNATPDLQALDSWLNSDA